RIKTNEKKLYETNKDKTYLAVYNLDTKKFIQLADLDLPEVEMADNAQFTLGYNDKPYLKDITWDDDYFDVYKVSLRDGTRKKIATRIKEEASLSPGGNYLCYFSDKNWYLYNCKTDSVSLLNKDLNYKFYDEDWDNPGEAPSYGVAGWIDNDYAVLIYDKYDIWKFSTTGMGFINQTAADGRINQVQMRLINLNPDKPGIALSEELYVSGFSTKKKNACIYRMSFDILGTERVIVEDCRTKVLAKTKDSKNIMFTKEKYDMFPDLWIADSMMASPKKLTNLQSQVDNYNWGKAELVSWKSYDGDTLQGYIIKPDNYVAGKAYPVLTYFYERFSDHLHLFYAPRLNHRPCYQMYSSDGYLIFVPDIKYKTGMPGMNAINCVTSGLKYLIDLGIADSAAIGIQGHSWGGYQTAYMITQTNMFAAACAGAPVGNMTSAYSGIRLESGRARQMQYEKQQSRIGGTLWDSLDAYIRNSPVFGAPKVKTPFMLMFGDQDDAVPWAQGVEIYLALRRLGKTCIFLQYHNEPHIPRKYHNKVDYAVKMKQFYDHYLMGKTAPDWLLKGIEYQGK
ncbi:MAG: prolyl oligopeptidase family serine peptidase, partial [Bacteroidota bacterium]